MIIQKKEAKKKHLLEKKRKKELEKKKQKIAKKRNELIDQKLREELDKKKNTRKVKKKIDDHKKKKEKSLQDDFPKPKKHNQKNINIDDYQSLFIINADLKRVNAVEYINKKKRIVLNKNREVRRTHAGGFSAEKFQKFVDQKKAKKVEWIIDLLNRPGVLKLPYQKIIINSDDKDIKENLEIYFKEKNKK